MPSPDQAMTRRLSIASGIQGEAPRMLREDHGCANLRLDPFSTGKRLEIQMFHFDRACDIPLTEEP